MLYRVFIVCLFLILCIFFIYFALKNKQIETFTSESERRTVVKTANNNYDPLNVFIYDETDKIRLEDSTSTSLRPTDKVLAIFYDIDKNNIIYKLDNDDTIQIINVYLSSNEYKIITLKDNGKVYDASTEIDGLSDIIQIAPNGDENFIALTSYNTLIKCNIVSNDPPIILESFDSNDPIISIQGFINSYTIVFLTMTGKLSYFNSGSLVSSSILVSSPSPSQSATVSSTITTDKVIQFNIPTYSDYNTVDDFPISYIDDKRKIVFKQNNSIPANDISISTNATPRSDSAHYSIVLYDTGTSTYKCYVVTNEKRLFSYTSETVGFLLSGDDTNINIDENILAIIAVNNKLYYLKNGTINCDLLDAGGIIYFPNVNNSCVTCGINADIDDSVTNVNSATGKPTTPVPDTASICKCRDPNKHMSSGDEVTEFAALTNANDAGCYNYASCPGVPDGTSTLSPLCPLGLYSSNVIYYNDYRTPNISELTSDSESDFVLDDEVSEIVCPKCVQCSITAAQAVGRGGTIDYGDQHPSAGQSISADDDCGDGSADGCQYYIKNICTSTRDTKFAKRTMWSDLNDNDKNQYSETIASGPPGNRYKFAQRVDNSEITELTTNNVPEGTASEPLGPSSSSDINPFYGIIQGKDDEFNSCIPQDCCVSGLGQDSPQYLYAMKESTNEEYNCENGNQRICNNCNKIYTCPINETPIQTTIFQTPFTSDNKHLNTFLEECGRMDVNSLKQAFNKHATLPDGCENLGIDCPVNGIVRTSCPDLFPSPCTSPDVDFTSCPDLFSQSS